MIGQTKLVRRLIMAALRPLTGVRAFATATVNCSGSSDVVLPKNSFAYPVPESAAGVADVDDQRLIRTTAETVVCQGVPATVPVSSVLGGVRHNSLRAGTRLLWSPPIAGLESHSVLATDMSGGLDPPAEHPAPVHDVTSFEEVTGANVAVELFQARLAGRIPSVVICWDRSDEGELKGKNSLHVGERWNLFVVVENMQGEQARRDEGLDIADAVRDLLVDKGVVDGCAFSDPPCTVLGRRRFAVTPTSLVYLVELLTHVASRRLDLRIFDEDGFVPGADQQPFDDWLSTRYTMSTVDGKTIIDRAVYNQSHGGFDSGFDDGFS